MSDSTELPTATPLRLVRATPGASPSDVLRSIGAYALGDTPSPEAKESVLRRWIRLMPTLDNVTIALQRSDLMRVGCFTAAELDTAIAAGSGGKPSTRAQGQRLILSDPEPWPDPVDGRALLDSIVDVLDRFVALEDYLPTAVALWIVFAHAHDAFRISPVLAITSPEKRCGKTTLLELLTALVPRPLPATNIAPAGVFRTVDRFEPTLLIDEGDTFLGASDELRGVLNGSNRRSLAYVTRLVGNEFEPRLFSTWCPKAVALIGSLPDTLADRSIEIRMQRRAHDEPCERLTLDRLEALDPIRRQAWRWTQEHRDELAGMNPPVPPELHDRAADNWRTLFGIADLVGDLWPELARETARRLHAKGDQVEDSLAVELLADIRALFEDRQVERLHSAAVVEALREREDRPWPEYSHGKSITPRQMAALLAPFGIKPEKMRIGFKNLRGYRQSDMEEAFRRYLPAAQPEQPEQSTQEADIPRIRDRNVRIGVPSAEDLADPQISALVPDVPDLVPDEEYLEYLLAEREGMAFNG